MELAGIHRREAPPRRFDSDPTGGGAEVRLHRRRGLAKILGPAARRRRLGLGLAVALFLTVLVAGLCYFFTSPQARTLSPEQIRTNTRLAQSLMQNLSSMAVPLCAVTDGPAACAAWRWALSRDDDSANTRPYTFALGGLSTDNLRGRRMRPLHRATWMTDPSMARHANNFEGRMLVIYILTEHHTRAGRGPSDALRGEAETAADILWLPNVGDPPLCQVEDGERCGVGRQRGLSPEFSMSRKVAAWLAYARLQFSRTPYIGKMDDDSYLRPSLILGHLDALATVRHPIAVTPEHLKMLYWGYTVPPPTEPMAFGQLYILGYGAVDALFRNAPTPMSALLGPPDRKLQSFYRSHVVYPEDWMVSYFVRLFARQNGMFFVCLDGCFTHDVPRLPEDRPITRHSLCIHHVYAEEMERLHRELPQAVVPVEADYGLYTSGVTPVLTVGCR